jgi:hypothetical protein
VRRDHPGPGALCCPAPGFGTFGTALRARARREQGPPQSRSDL